MSRLPAERHLSTSEMPPPWSYARHMGTAVLLELTGELTAALSEHAGPASDVMRDRAGRLMYAGGRHAARANGILRRWRNPNQR